MLKLNIGLEKYRWAYSSCCSKNIAQLQPCHAWFQHCRGE